MCTIAHTPRLPEHCIEYVRVLRWPQDKPFGGMYFKIYFIIRVTFLYMVRAIPHSKTVINFLGASNVYQKGLANVCHIICKCLKPSKHFSKKNEINL